MASGRDVIASKHISFSSDALQQERRQVDESVPNYVQYVLRRIFVPWRFGSGCGFCCRIFSILFIRIQLKTVHIGNHIGSQALRASSVMAVLVVWWLYLALTMPVVHRHGRGRRLGACLVVKQCVVVELLNCRKIYVTTKEQA